MNNNAGIPAIPGSLRMQTTLTKTATENDQKEKGKKCIYIVPLL